MFLVQILTSDKFCRILTSKSFNHLWTTLNRYRSNIHELDKAFFLALLNSLSIISENYMKRAINYKTIKSMEIDYGFR